MKNINVEKCISRLLKEFPEFVGKMKPDDLQPFMLFGDLGIYIRDVIDGDKTEATELNKIFNFLNEMSQSNDEEVQNLLTVGVLEIITDSKKATAVARKYLKGEALSNLNLIQKFWYEE